MSINGCFCSVTSPHPNDWSPQEKRRHTRASLYSIHTHVIYKNMCRPWQVSRWRRPAVCQERTPGIGETTNHQALQTTGRGNARKQELKTCSFKWKVERSEAAGSKLLSFFISLQRTAEGPIPSPCGLAPPFPPVQARPGPNAQGYPAGLRNTWTLEAASRSAPLYQGAPLRGRKGSSRI